MDHQDEILRILADLRTCRIDIKNFGTETNAVEIEANGMSISEPSWFTNEEGKGKVLQSSDMKSVIKIKAINDGNLRISFRSQDKRFNDEHYPLWIDYKSIKINGEELLFMPVATWHDKPYLYETPVKDGQEVTLEVEQQYRLYMKKEVKDLLSKLYPNDNFVCKHINEISDEISEKTEEYSEIELKDFPQITADCFIPIGEACRPANWLKEYGLRYCSLPFDWLGECKLPFIVKSIVNGIDDWFSEYRLDSSKDNKTCRYVYDTKNCFRSRHAFPVDKTVDEYMPEFKEIFRRRCERLVGIIKESDTICFVCNNRWDTIYNFYLFIKKIKELYPHKSYKLLHVHQKFE